MRMKQVSILICMLLCTCFTSVVIANHPHSTSGDPIDYDFYFLPKSSLMDGVQGKLSNSGNIPLTNVAWTISTEGGFFGRLDKSRSGTIPVLPAHSVVNVEGKPVFGICIFKIRFEATSDQGISSVSVCTGHLLFNKIYIEN